MAFFQGRYQALMYLAFTGYLPVTYRILNLDVLVTYLELTGYLHFTPLVFSYLPGTQQVHITFWYIILSKYQACIW